ncbi:N-acetyl-alpha-D-glucosaminyl L-malate synthase BshA [Gracilibacillus caseinilyticus]|uniref:N-acetyl-alpha-D-glucosaminyl L-malate synthase BshA n=1 Tax=Gracilibacillus caseinilyticus TaxID=2932256 RepID=A0ABY4EU50_9BACI|nr:N-acetyl-alpha-D-glucosaminyl L-malate synthase BshA [Gracilibacillus caseinilyticus]UOQ47596.1 N-acetyl-alpha-D-glucosaminyl L-malate synthase BshA [Gracilibacillus caseinilyticus]
MLKIGITCYPSVGGSGIIATELGKMLAKQGHEIHFITSSIPFRLDSFYPNIFFHEVELNHYPVFQYPPYDLALATKMAEVIDTEQIDIIHAHYAVPHAICAILAKQMAKHPVKIVTTLHGTDITVLGIDHSLKKMIQFGIEQSDAATAVSESLVGQTKEMLGVKCPLHVIYNFVNELEYVPNQKHHLKQKYGMADDDKVLIHISNFRKVKRLEDVIHTFQKVHEKEPSHLLLIGDGPEYGQIYDLVRALGLEEVVHFLGKQKNIPELLSIADIKLLLSEKESFGLVLLEAMACGVPCVGSNIGGIPEVIADGETGFIEELGDTEAFASRVLELLQNKQKWQQFSENAIERVTHRFSSEKIRKQYESLYYQVLGE